MTQKRVCITGGAGFIGSNLARRFVNDGWHVTVVDDLSNGRREFLPAINGLIVGDFASSEVLDAIRADKFDVVFHLAAKPRVSYSVEHPLETNDTNVTKTLALLDACKGHVNRFVNTSSSSVYGNTPFLPTAEHVIHAPVSPYALQKSITEQYCRLYSNVYGLDTVSVRPFNVFGINQAGDSPYALAVSAWLYAIKHGKPLRSDGDGTQTRDITYVSNVVDVFMACAEYKGKLNGEAFNAGAGGRISNNEVLQWFKKHYPDCQINHAPPRAGDVKDTQASTERTTAVLGVTPKVDFWRGLELTHTWAMNSPLF